MKTLGYLLIKSSFFVSIIQLPSSISFIHEQQDTYHLKQLSASASTRRNTVSPHLNIDSDSTDYFPPFVNIYHTHNYTNPRNRHQTKPNQTVTTQTLAREPWMRFIFFPTSGKADPLPIPDLEEESIVGGFNSLFQFGSM